MDERDWLAERFEEHRTRLAGRPARAHQRRRRAISTREGKPFSVGGFTIRDGKIVAMDILADPERLSQLDLTILDG
jgi:hypothetical protein